MDTIWDSGGIDKFDASASTTGVILDLRQGKFSTFGDYQDVVVAYGTVIENAVGGAGKDIIRGNSGKNHLSGGLLKDVIRGKAGTDFINGNKGTDNFVFKGKFGKDVVRDFADDVDTLKIHHADAPTVSAVLDLAHEANGDVIFDFSDGARITVLNTTILALTDDITII